mgnify:CR=1 FL=1
MNQDEHKIMVRRMAALIAVASVLIAVYVLRLIFLQLVNGESFKAQATNTTDYNFTVTAARGDIVDSAGALLLVRAGKRLLDDFDLVLEALKKFSLEHKGLICMGRTHGIHAEPTTYALKFAGFYAEFRRHRERFAAAVEDIRTAKISGAVGTYAFLSPDIEKRACEILGLKPDTISTQIIQRDRYAHYFTTLAIAGGGIERLCTELRHLQRTEVHEVEEGFAKGQKGSSAMPHKRNPISAENLCGVARLLRGNALASLESQALWHERDISHSSVERVIMPDCTGWPP